MGKAYTEMRLHTDYMNVRVLGRFLQKHPQCSIVRTEYNYAKSRVDWAKEQRKKHVTGRQQCPERNKGEKHFAIMDGAIGPTYRCLYCCADMS